jgi:hypothetical protein
MNAMKDQRKRRISRALTPRQMAMLKRHRARIARELPDLAARDRIRQEAREEPTLSGELRRAIQSSPLGLAEIAHDAGVTPLALDEFLTGEKTLRSDVLDRLAAGVGFMLSRSM